MAVRILGCEGGSRGRVTDRRVPSQALLQLSRSAGKETKHSHAIDSSEEMMDEWCGGFWKLYEARRRRRL
jgi:hypothetical protein